MGRSAQLALPRLPILPDVTQGRASGVCTPRDKDAQLPFAISIVLGHTDIVEANLPSIDQLSGRLT